MNSRENRKKRTPGFAPEEPNPMKPVSLTPAELSNEPARPVESHPYQPRQTPMVSYGDHALSAKKVTEQRYDFAPVRENRFALKQEQSLNYQLQPITVSPIQMQLLQERRVAARDLGWVVPGHRIRIGE